MKSNEIRKRFLEFFARRDHEMVPSSPLVPANDPTLLFTNAGMVQFKDAFLGLEKRPYVRATSSQRCVRAGGKHNDLENVGYTARHHTFFEMLGNFSFGDYFKREAIHYAWEFLTEEMKLPPEKLWVTVYEDDDEAADIWLTEMKVDPNRFSRLGEKDNFWSMGDTGPCGPCSEIFYDHGPDVPGGPPGTPDEDGDRYVEIWNLVFMQYNRDVDHTLTDLPKPSVDTGMGLERLAAVMQGVQSNYQIDLFQGLIKAAGTILNIKKPSGSHSLQVIADHIRSTSFMIGDGVFPSNEGRGYVLRRIIRRAIRHGHQLGAEEVFFYRLVQPLIDEMGAAYPELARNQAQIEKVLRQEEERFIETLEKGLRILDQDIDQMKGDTIAGATVFQLYDTYGFPVDLTADIARERNLKLDMEGFNREMDGQRDRARAASSFKSSAVVSLDAMRDESSDFTGYEKTEDRAVVQSIYTGDEQRDSLSAGESGVVFLNQTSFYSESGGQVGDQGWLHTDNMVFRVENTVKGHAHVGIVEKGEIKVGDQLTCEVDASLRQATAYNHSATHLLHAALKRVLGDHVQQKGSLVSSERLRFDFSHSEPVTHDQLYEIELIVNEQVRANAPVETKVMDIQDAMNSGAMALFGEKYGDKVRVVGMGDFSVELCGGTHVGRTGDIGVFKIVSESGVAAGVRRIEAVTGETALAYLSETDDRLMEIARTVKGGRDDVGEKVDQLTQRLRSMEKEMEQLKAKFASNQGDGLTDQAQEIDGVKVLAVRLDGVQAKDLRNTLDRLKDKLGSAAIVLATVEGDKVSLVAGVTRDLVKRLHAGKLVGEVAAKVGGKGGGRPDMAQAGGNDPAALDAALASVPGWIKQQLAG